MASTTKKKRLKATAQRRSAVRDEHLKELVKEAVREVLHEERAANGNQAPLVDKGRQELVALALQARGSWQENEGTGTSVEIVRRLRDEWKHRPN